MRKWWRIVRFVKAQRKKGNPDFEVLTTSSEIILWAKDGGKGDELRINYK